MTKSKAKEIPDGLNGKRFQSFVIILVKSNSSPGSLKPEGVGAPDRKLNRENDSNSGFGPIFWKSKKEVIKI